MDPGPAALPAFSEVVEVDPHGLGLAGQRGGGDGAEQEAEACHAELGPPHGFFPTA
jgi:hypothetical protein